MSNICRHKVFISYYHKDDQQYKDKLISMKIYDEEDKCTKPVFDDYSVRDNDIDDDLSAEQIRRIIRDKYIKDATVLVLLCGRNTKGRKHIDWELHAAMYNSEKNKQMGILVINLPTISQNIRAGTPEEKGLLSDGGEWYSIKDRKEFEEKYPYMPERIIDNFMKQDVHISVVEWNRIANNPRRLIALIDKAFEKRFDFSYDHSTPMRKNNSSLI